MLMAPPYKVQPVKFKPKNKGKNFDKIPDGLPKPTSGGSGMSCTLVAKRKSGKTSLICDLLLNASYAKCYSVVVLVSPTIFLDPQWQSLEKLKNVVCSDDISNEFLEGLLKRQKETYMADPEWSMLLVLDDCGGFLKSKTARRLVDSLYTTGRHYAVSCIVTCQSVTQLTSTQLSNTQFWLFWAVDGRALKKISQELSCHLSPKEFEEVLKKATRKKYDFLFINLEASSDDLIFRKNFTEDIE